MEDDGSSGEGGNGSGDNNSDVPDDLTEYYATTTDRLFRVQEVNNTDYPSPAGFVVKIGDEQYTSGKSVAYGTDDIQATVPTGYEGDISISKDGYFDYVIPSQYTSQYNVVTMWKKSYKNPFPQMLLVKDGSKINSGYTNVLAEGLMLYENSLDDYNGSQKVLKCYTSINWNGHGAGSRWNDHQGEDSDKYL